MMKDSGFRIRVERDLREQFLEACRAKDLPAAQVLREIMRDYVAENTQDEEMSKRTAPRAKAESRGNK